MKTKEPTVKKPPNKPAGVKCWEVFNCDKTECPAYKSKNLKCWLLSGTHCRNEIQGKFIEKLELCLGCKVLRATRDVAAMKVTLGVVGRQFREYNRIIGERDRELEAMSMELAISLCEVFEALKKIASGDPTVRIPENSDIELISGLKHMVNLTAEQIGEIVDQAHEIAIGLAEHFEVLHKVSRGQMDARVSSGSNIELLESLKTVTNEMIQSISHEINERSKVEEILRKRTYDLWERVKEINCLYGVSELTEKRSIPQDEVFQGIVDRIPYGWRYPEIACARIALGDREFRTKNFRQTVWKQESGIPVYGILIGAVEVYYLEERPLCDEGPFTKEERNLLDAISRHCERYIERMRSRQALRESEEKYRTVFENTGSATIIVEEDTTISLVNTKFEMLSGYTKEEIEGRKSWTDFFDESDIEKMKKYHYARRSHAVGDLSKSFEARFIDRQGGVRNVLLSASVIPGTKKTVESLIDITERKKLEEQMLHTEKLASIGTLAAGVAHEINNPLAIILGFTDLLIERFSEDADSYDLLKTIQKQGNNAKRIVENLLSFVRYREHREEAVDVNRIIEELIAVKKKSLAIDNISVLTELAASIPAVKADTNELQQVFFNIINNAVPAMKGGGRLLIQTRMRDGESGRQVEIRIADTGTGILPEHRSRIFDPLFTTKKVGEGTGLGLTVSYAIIKKYGGSITFETRTKQESPSDSGTTFIITLPAMDALEIQ
ncbi:MAG: PAS domain S-box protein [Nitrospirota bacterium]